MEEHKSQEFKNRSRSYFEKLSSHYSGSHISQYTAPMHDYLISELDKIDLGHYWISDVELASSC